MLYCFHTKMSEDATAAGSSTAEQEAPVPSDKVKLRLLLTNGQKADFIFSPGDTIEYVKRHVFENWPSGIEDIIPTTS